jgi:hypothetical protein
MSETPKGRPQGGMRSPEGQSTYWRMRWESAIGALADLIAEHTETVEELKSVSKAKACCVYCEHCKDTK